MHKIFGITGWKNSGKTHMVASVVKDLRARGLKVSTIKHAHHAFDIDHANTDTWQHRQAGAGEVAIVSSKRWALMHELENEEEPNLYQIASKLAPCDLIIVEGYKGETHPKIEMIRKECSPNSPIWKTDNSIVAIATDNENYDTIANCKLPILSVDNIKEIADFVLSNAAPMDEANNASK